MNKEERLLLAAEIRHTTARLEALYAAQYRGDRTVLTRQRVERLEALLTAFQGYPEALDA
ncbi:hypothetical protein ACFUIW_10965 [Streptomyces sp. NPDC057245]|uniref:hypothetical protein n=1 Tax=Streptomyces sp. NPDC057245 TaxID=3346065 RepID=UPI00363FEF05